MIVNDNKKSMGIEEKQVILLQNEMNNLNIIKANRIQIPTVICTLLICISGFIINSRTIPSDNFQKIGVIAVLLIISLAGLLTLREINKQYHIMVETIFHIYEQLGVKGENFFPHNIDFDNPTQRKAQGIFNAGYISMALICLICVFGILIK